MGQSLSDKLIQPFWYNAYGPNSNTYTSQLLYLAHERQPQIQYVETVDNAPGWSSRRGDDYSYGGRFDKWGKPNYAAIRYYARKYQEDRRAYSNRSHGICFVAGTKIRTDNGIRPIEYISVGDLVLSWNPESGSFEHKAVDRLIRSATRAFTFVQGEGWNIVCTTDHPFLVDGKWKLSKDLMPGDFLLDAKGQHVRITAVVGMASETDAEVFNFTVRDTHTYCVTEFGFVVHNR
jgi:hypothetical protein